MYNGSGESSVKTAVRATMTQLFSAMTENALAKVNIDLLPN